MFGDESPARRADADSLRAAQRVLRPADRHARRLGVLGCVERPPEPDALPRQATAGGRPVLSRAALIALPVVAASCPDVIAAGTVLPFPMVAA